jgi:photosystem II stability/assembly factor-like uncharacterized protein
LLLIRCCCTRLLRINAYHLVQSLAADLTPLVPLFLTRSYLNEEIAYACGGSGSLFKSVDGGKSWKRDRATDNVAGNLYAIKFFKGNGFILGNDGILLRYIGGTQPNTA